MRVMLFTASDTDDEIAQFRRLRDGADVDAFVHHRDHLRRPPHRMARERAGAVRLVRAAVGRRDIDDPDRLWVDVDGQAGIHEATRHLIDRGLGRIGYLGWPVGSGTGDDRRTGWELAMAEAFGLGPEDLAALTTTTTEGVARARIAIEALFHAGTELEGLVCASDSLALGAMMAAREAGLTHFPIMGFDNTPVAQAVGLSSVDQRLALVAQGTLELLMGATGRRVLPHGAGTEDPRHRLITPQLVVRRSSHLALVEEAGGTRPAITNERKRAHE